MLRLRLVWHREAHCHKGKNQGPQIEEKEDLGKGAVSGDTPKGGNNDSTLPAFGPSPVIQ